MRPDDRDLNGREIEDELRKEFDAIEREAERDRSPFSFDDLPTAESEGRSDRSTSSPSEAFGPEFHLEEGDLIGSAKRSNDAIDDSFQSRLDELGKKVEDLRGTRESQRISKEKEQRQQQDIGRGTGLGLTIAYTIMGMPMLGAGAGWLLDRQFGTQNWMGILTLLGAVLGIVAVVSLLNREQSGR